MLQAVAFDLDHTLYDRAATFAALSPAFADSFRACLDEKLSLDDLTLALQETDSATCNRTNWPGVYELLISRGVFTRAPGLDFFTDYILKVFPASVVPYPDTYDVIESCRARGLKTAIITNGLLDIQSRKIDSLNLREYMDLCVISAEVGKHKPAPEPFWYAAEKLGLSPESIMFVGDNPQNDVWGSRNAGMLPVWFDVLHDWDDTIASAPTIHSLSELLPMLDDILS